MRKSFLIAGVAAIALSAPLAAKPDREGKGGGEAKAERAEKPQRAEHKAEHQQALPQRMERAERKAQRSERQQPNFERRIERQVQRVERQQPRIERQVEKAERRAQRVEQRIQKFDRKAERVEQRQARKVERFQARDAVKAFREVNRSDRQAIRAGQQALAAQTWQQRVSSADAAKAAAALSLATLGQRIEPLWYDDYVPVMYRTSYFDQPDYYYRTDWDDGYMYRVDKDTNLVSALIPLLGGALGIGNPYPVNYNSYYGTPLYSAGFDPYQGVGYSPYYNVPMGYRSLYYDTPDSYYRYGSGAIYQVDPKTQLITAIVSLLTGANFNVGQQMPMGYDAYNVPYAYRDQYYDTSDAWYRYDDGYVYQIDPRSRMVMSAYPAAYNGFALGSPIADPYWDDYYADYNVPYGYRDVYADSDDSYYRYYNNGIYQVDPKTRMVQSLVALVTGNNWGVGQALPVGYDVYNVPLQYRDRYYDNDQYMYRYADGYIYQVDPKTRLIQAVIDAIV